MDRRSFLKIGVGSAASTLVLSSVPFSRLTAATQQPPFKISLAQWSLNKRFFGRVQPKLDALEFAKIANSFGAEGLEYVNQFFMDKARDKAYLAELKQRAEDYGLTSVLIMCDNEGNLGDPDEKKRLQTVENHIKWLEAAKFLGCHSIRVNAYSEGSYEEQQKLVTDGLRRLCEKAQPFGLNVIVENHGRLTSNPDWLLGVMEGVGLPNVGTLPDFGNFGEYDPYRGVRMLMPYAKGVSAKASFNPDGTCRTVDYPKMMRIVRDAGWDGFVGIESGSSGDFTEMDAIRMTRDMLVDIREQWAKTPPILTDSLTGWKRIAGGDWNVKDGVLTGRNGKNWSSDPNVPGSWLYYDERVKDFRFEFQYKITDGGNSGVLFRSALEKNPGFTGYEMQITTNQDAATNAKTTPGAIYDLAVPSKNAARPAGEWNTVTIIAKGANVVVEMNHERVVETQLDRSMQGFLGFQNHDEESVVQFKNVRLQLL